MTYDGNGYTLLDVREHLIAADGCLPPDVDRPSLVELAEQDELDRREARRG